MGKPLVELTLDYFKETELAIQVGDGASRLWLPKSQIEFEVSADHDTVEITMPEWLALEKELV